jgi:serine/threonine protein kinase
MKQEISFIQYALTLKYVKPGRVATFFQHHPYQAIPGNIADLMVRDGLLTAEQAETIYQRMGEEPLSPETSEQEALQNLSITFSSGSVLNIPYVENDLPDQVMTQSDDAEGMVLSSLTQSDMMPVPIVIEAEEEELPLPLPADKEAAQESSVPDMEETPSQEIPSPMKTVQAPEQSRGKGDSLHNTVDMASQSSLTDTAAKTALGKSSPHSLSATRIVLEEDIALGQQAVQKSLIRMEDLQGAIAEIKRGSQEGRSMSLRDLFISKKLLTAQQIAELKTQSQTRSSDPWLAKLGIQEVLMGKYRIIEKLGSGGMGMVYKVQHILLNSYFALKFMHPQFADNEKNYKRFVREVQVAMNLMHKNIVTIREFGLLSEKMPYLIMDYSPGRPLDKVLQNNWNCDLARSLEITRQVLDGLTEAHRHNVIHRDLKPANLLIEQDADGKDVVKIVDFGLAKLVAEAEQQESLTQEVVGTPLYMAPEQAAGEKVDRRSDIYSVGLILYEMMAGRKAFQARSYQATLIQQMFLQPTPVSQINPHIPEAVEAVVMKSLSKDPAQRQQTVQDFIAEIDKATVSLEAAVTRVEPIAWKKLVLRQGADSMVDQPTELTADDETLRRDNVKTKEFMTIYVQEHEGRYREALEALYKLKETGLWNNEMSGWEAKLLEKQETLSLNRSQGFKYWQEEKNPFKALPYLQKAIELSPSDADVKRSLDEVEDFLEQSHKSGQFWQRLKAEKAAAEAMAAPEGFVYVRTTIYGAGETTSKVHEYKHEASGIEFALVPGGSFAMGSNDRPASKPVHNVTIEPFLLAKYTVTQEVWHKIMQTSPWLGQDNVQEGDAYPAVYVSWSEAQNFCRKTGLSLPSEAQWEYACRAGSKGRYYWEDAAAGDFAWYYENTSDLEEDYAHKVGQKRPNLFGLYDMSGNLWQWCADAWHDNYESAPNDGKLWTAAKTAFFVCRGGSYADPLRCCASAYRGKEDAMHKGSDIAFRVCMWV